MKKILSMILVLAMAMTMTAFAAEGSWNGTEYNGNTADVTATYADGTTSVVNVCRVVISWSVTNGSKTEGNVAYTWDANLHKYVPGDATGATQTDPSVTVSLTNHSDVPLTANIVYNDKAEDEVVSSAVAINDVALVTGVSVTDDNYAGATYNQPDAVVRTMTIAITDWSKLTEADQIIGTVTVTLSK